MSACRVCKGCGRRSSALVQEAEAHGGAVSFSDLSKSNITHPESSNPFNALDSLDEASWELEKSGKLEIPGPKLPSFPDDGGDAAPTGDGVELAQKSGSVPTITGQQGGMSMDHHASITLAAKTRDNIRDAEERN